MTGEDIRAFRIAAGLTQSGLAAQFRTTRNTIARWERGSVPIPPIVTCLVAALKENKVFAAKIVSLNEELGTAKNNLQEKNLQISQLKFKIEELRLKTGIRSGRISSKDLREFFASNFGFKASTTPDQDLDKVYKRIAKKYHPDQNPEHAEVMKDINELMQALKE
jgi:transcriptional regulator with XRE-family HTH domain